MAAVIFLRTGTTPNLEKRIKIIFFQPETKMGCSRVLPSKVCCCSLDLGLQVIFFLCPKVGIGMIFNRSDDKTVILPPQCVFVNAFSIIHSLLQALVGSLSFLRLAGIICSGFYGCPPFDTFHCYFLWLPSF